ncbi:GNAT family N-acetyltransferase [Pyxidicoccus fallax]|uniref:Alanine--tRNA ligase n=1 Tax=Pyxidicoccus fallax TaxID=394095 RepID=A0A848LDH9_9BACT|nr:DHHA1 domain-containing protein [Pyxidicoccus fallax]NMO14853.1 GNAT family N-acetyltransferase [Pyxidicoccus fallax]NPC79701.1 GNAT family N-acetyltransferase [Pyxidicoccus fallax]
MNLYDERDITSAPWPDTEAGRDARDFLVPLFQQGAMAFFSERTRFRLLEVDGLLMPLSINDAEYGNTGVFSPFARYITNQRAALADNEAFAGVKGQLVSRVLQGVGGVLKAARINKCVFVDNWPTLRNTTPLLSAEQVRRLTRFLTERFPGHAIAFPALSPATHSPLLDVLAECGYTALYTPYSRMGLAHGEDPHRKVRENRRRDAKLLEGSGYQLVDARELPGCAPRLCELYRMLNREKYRTNPDARPEYFETALRGGLIQLRALVKDGRIDVFYGFSVTGDVLWSPVAGYDLSVPREVGLYRILNSLLLKEAVDRGLVIETGAGADEFKSLRGDRPLPRYCVVYTDHLLPHRKAGWRLLQRFANDSLLPAARAYLRRIDGDTVVGFDGVPQRFTPPFTSPSESVALLRQELDAMEAELEAVSRLPKREQGGRLAALTKRLEDWPAPPPPRVSELREKLGRVTQRLSEEKAGRSREATRTRRAELARSLVASAVKVGDTTLVLSHLGSAPTEQLRSIAHAVREAAASSAVVLTGTQGHKVLVVAATAPELLPRGVDASGLLAQVTPAVEGRAEGGPELAWGEGTRPEGVAAALEAARQFLQSRLGG